ncbi:phospholipid phosphatase 1-like [Saccoglossus kowalevskii]|uniref:Lipid phosphate phosphohydrolase 1-like n=1 Tax=Saccoglossus kowalevskii TaxID=10224 RepID=A0ABM0H0M8_SACKO|nr:PREDICTED: lipid phosphate phosphohydrolase 1-like [Saccoglossus kowalevskii]
MGTLANNAVNLLIFSATAYLSWHIECVVQYFVPDRHKDAMFDIKDASLYYPARSTLPLTMLVQAVAVTSFVVLALGELTCVLCGKYSLKHGLFNFYYLYGAFLFGWCFHRIFVMVTKGMLVSPRPSFLESCQPDMSKISSQDLLVSFDKCSNQKSLKDASGAFPSGHSALIYYECCFLMFYIDNKLPENTPKLLKGLLQAVLFLVPFFVSLTRIVDNRHWWSDVIAGILLGVILAIWVANICGLFRKHTGKPPKKIKAKKE